MLGFAPSAVLGTRQVRLQCAVLALETSKLLLQQLLPFLGGLALVKNDGRNRWEKRYQWIGLRENHGIFHGFSHDIRGCPLDYP